MGSSCEVEESQQTPPHLDNRHRPGSPVLTSIFSTLGGDFDLRFCLIQLVKLNTQPSGGPDLAQGEFLSANNDSPPHGRHTRIDLLKIPILALPLLFTNIQTLYVQSRLTKGYA
jgi:hypothetical protein